MRSGLPAKAAPSPGSWWVRTVPGWHAAFAAFVALAVAALALVPAPDPALAGGALTGVVVAYLLRGVPGARRRRGHARPYLAVMVVGFSTVFAGAPGLSFLLFIAFPQAWFFTDTRREGTVWTVATALGALVGLVAGHGSLATAPEVAVSMGVSVVFTCALGFWISKVVEQSEERAELITELETTRAELAAAHHEAGVAAERARLAGDIHDTLAQSFTSIVVLAQSAAAGAVDEATRRRLELVEDTARSGLAEARTLVAAMSPVGLEDVALTEALHRLGERVSRESGVRVRVQVDGEVRGLPRAQQVVLLRAAQEALGNVRKHAAARTAQVLLSAEDASVVLEVHDDGVGIAATAAAAGGGFGLAGMRRRVEEAGGVVEVVGAPGAGTRLRVAVPAPPPPVPPGASGAGVEPVP